MRRGLRLFAAALVVLALSSCFESKPKLLGNNKISLDTEDTANNENFKFNFAYLDTGAAGVHARTVTLQGASTAKSAIIATCNGAGTACVCEYLNAAGTEIGESDSATIQLDSTGNYIRCNYPAAMAVPDKVRLRNVAETKLSTTLSIKTPAAGARPITVQELFADLDVNRVRTISRYFCQFNFLQKKNATSGSVDCTDQNANPCEGVGPDSREMCLLQALYPFYLFADTLASNFGDKIADLLYNAGGSDRICNRQLKRIDCTGAAGTPTADFGLYNEQTGIYQIALGLSAGPSIANQTYGFAAEQDTFLATAICPPALVAKKIYEATPDPTTMQVGVPDGINDNNVPAGFTAFNIDDATAPTLTSLDFVKRAGGVDAVQCPSGTCGDCDGSDCSIAQTLISATAFAYAVSVSTPTTLCVVPDDLL